MPQKGGRRSKRSVGAAKMPKKGGGCSKKGGSRAWFLSHRCVTCRLW